jgi:thiol-disulfide isomerase/thioredoxin
MAERGKDFRFTNTRSTKALPNRYKVIFDQNSEDAFPAVLILNNIEGTLDATFLTETGDFRFLEGNIMNERIYLSAFDGSHVFYFEAEISGDSLVNGIFRSGPTYEASWEAAADSLYELTPPDKLTYMEEGYKYVELPFPNQDGDTLDWKGLDLENKVVVIDIFGSWCPNCMDASIALHELTKKYSDNDIAIVPVAFELTQELSVARERVFKMQNDLGLPTHFLFGGTASKKNAAAKFPMLNNISSFPTIIIVDKKRNVRSVYTGFYGPGTGTHYDKFMQETDALLASLVAEN